MNEEIVKVFEDYGYDIDFSNFEFERASSTKIEGNKIYYQSIPKAMLSLITKQQIVTDIPRTGLMLDVSRGPVNTVENLKQQLVTFCMLGYDYVMLYMEDMFDIDISAFGYLRGKYLEQEVQEVVNFASLLEIEIIPCIQTLGHYENFVKWDIKEEYKDTDSVLNISSPKALELIDRTIAFCAKNFKSSTIHIGLDEAADLGRGVYLKEYGFESQAKLFYTHIEYVYNKCLECDYQEIIIWSDMLFTADGRAGELYNNKINNKLVASLLQFGKLKFCYWNYWSQTVKEHGNLIDQHLALVPKDRIYCAGGVNQWKQLTYLLDSNISFNALTGAMRERGLNELLLTIWFDGAGYTNFNTTKYGIYERAMNLHNLNIDQKLFEQIFKIDYKQVCKLCEFSLKYKDAPTMLWDNPLNLVYLKNTTIDPIALESELITIDVCEQLQYTKILVNFTIRKTLFGQGCLKGEINIKEVKELIKTCDDLNREFRQYWLSMYKPQGMGHVQGQFALLKNRFEEILFRLENNIPMPELEEIADVEVQDNFKSVFYATNYRN